MGRSFPLRVTFDANVIDKAVRPERSPKDPNRGAYEAVHGALVDGRLRGFFCAPLVTLEGIPLGDRAAVFGGTRTTTSIENVIGNDGALIHKVTSKVEQAGRAPLHPEMRARFTAALDLGLKVLGVPRIGMTPIEDPDGRLHAAETPAEQTARQTRSGDATTAIEARGLGSVPAKRIAHEFAARDHLAGHWFNHLGLARDEADRRRVGRAIAEWSDGDSVAAHIGYANDLFCTHDRGKSAGGPSVLNDENRAWLTSTYGVQFVTLAELAAFL